jgi:hypothetical protein
MALGHITAARIQSLSDSSPQGVACNDWYAVDRDAFVQEAQWTFARVSLVLTPITYPDNNWAYAYAYPQDCLKIDRLKLPELLGGTINAPSIPNTFPTGLSYINNEDEVPMEKAVILDVNNKPTGQFALLCNLPSAILVYTRQIEDPNMWPPTFLKAFTLYLALDLAGSLNASPQVIQTIESRLQEARAIAKRASADETTDNGSNVSNIERARRGGRGESYNKRYRY